MARTSERVRNYSIGKGDYKGYYGCEELKDILFDIRNQNKSWGKDWYSKVEVRAYESAKVLLAIHGKGENVGKAIDIINRIMDIEAEEA